MGSEWTYSTIADCASEEPFSTQIGSFGNKIKAEIYTPEGAPVLLGTNVNTYSRFHDSDFVFIDQDYSDSEFEKFTCKAGDTLGYPAFVPPSAQLTYHHNQRIGLVCVERQEIGKHYLYQILRSRAYRDEILGAMSGSTVKHTSPSKIKSFTFPFAGGQLAQWFEDVSRAIEAKITANDSASETLIKLRDCLLPKPISGDLSLSVNQPLTT